MVWQATDALICCEKGPTSLNVSITFVLSQYCLCRWLSSYPESGPPSKDLPAGYVPTQPSSSMASSIRLRSASIWLNLTITTPTTGSVRLESLISFVRNKICSKERWLMVDWQLRLKSLQNKFWDDRGKTDTGKRVRMAKNLRQEPSVAHLVLSHFCARSQNQFFGHSS